MLLKMLCARLLVVVFICSTWKFHTFHHIQIESWLGRVTMHSRNGKKEGRLEARREEIVGKTHGVKKVHMLAVCM